MKVFTITNQKISLGTRVVPFTLYRHTPPVKINAILVGRFTKGQRMGILCVKPHRDTDNTQPFTLEHAYTTTSKTGNITLKEAKYSIDNGVIVVSKIFVPHQCETQYLFEQPQSAQTICTTTTSRNKDQCVFTLSNPTSFSILIFPPTLDKRPLHPRFHAFNTLIHRNFSFNGETIQEIK